MKKLFYSIISILLAATLVYGAGSLQTIFSLPQSNSSFLIDLQTFLRNEDANRAQYYARGWVASGGTHATGAGLTHTPTALVAFPAGFYTTESGSITYPDADTCYVIADPNLTGNLTTFTRVSGTHYLMDCNSASPATPSTAVSLMTVTTAGGAVTVVTDTRVITPYGVSQGAIGLQSYAVGDLLYADTTTSLARLADIATTNVLLSGGVGVAPSWGKVALGSAVSGLLTCSNGGTNSSAAATNGQLLIGNGTCFTVASLTAGTGITVTPGAGTLSIATTTTATGLFGSRNLLGVNNAGAPTTSFDISADSATFWVPADATGFTANGVSVVTVNTSTAGPAANGRDQAAAFSADSWVHFYLIQGASGTAGIASAVAPSTGPTLLAGYTRWAYVGAVRFNAASQLITTRIQGNKACYAVAQNALTNGVSTVEAAISLTSLVPPNNLGVSFRTQQDMTAGGAADTSTATLRFITGGNYFSSLNYGGRDERVVQTVDMPVISQSIFYILTNTGAATSQFDVDVLCYKMPNGAT